jgi:hypothetical protein
MTRPRQLMPSTYPQIEAMAVAESSIAGYSGGAVLDGATTFQPWIRKFLTAAQMYPFCFNGATTFQPWIRMGERNIIQPLTVSMGPRLFSHGYRNKRRIVSFMEERFNGATTFQPWIPSMKKLQTFLMSGFNGATTFQPWIQERKKDVFSFLGMFQWGHDFSAMDTAAIFWPLLLSKKSRFSRGSSTSYKTFRMSTLVRRHFRYAEAFRAGPRVLDTTPPLAKLLPKRDLFGPVSVPLDGRP